MYNFTPLPEPLYKKSIIRVTDNNSIDITRLLVSLESVGSNWYDYFVFLDKTSELNDVVIGFYNGNSSHVNIEVEGNEQQAVSNYHQENDVKYFVLSISKKGNSINFVRTANNKICFLNIS